MRGDEARLPVLVNKVLALQQRQREAALVVLEQPSAVAVPVQSERSLTFSTFAAAMGLKVKHSK